MSDTTTDVATSRISWAKAKEGTFISDKLARASQTSNVFMGRYGSNPQGVTAKQYLVGRAAQVSWGETMYRINGNKGRTFPDVMIMLAGSIPIPFYQVQYFEVARSQDLLQYRAIGGEFLAQQEGGNTGVRMDLLLSGPNQASMVAIIKAIQIFSMSEEQYYEWSKHENAGFQQTEFEEKNVTGTLENTSGISLHPNDTDATYNGVISVSLINFAQTIGVDASIKPAYGLTNYDSVVSTNPNPAAVAAGKTAPAITFGDGLVQVDGEHTKIESKEEVLREGVKTDNMSLVGRDDFSWARSTWHKVFNVWTREEILFDMYIETIAFRRKVDGGSHVTEVNILMRHFTPPDPVDCTKMFAMISSEPDNSLSKLTVDKNVEYLRGVKTKKYVSVGDPPKSKRMKTVFSTVSDKPWVADFAFNVIHRATMQQARYGLLLSYQDLKEKNVTGGIMYNKIRAGDVVNKSTNNLGVI